MKKSILIILLILIVVFSLFVNCKSDEPSDNTSIQSDLELQVGSISKEIEKPKYTPEELALLARVIWCEAGSNWLTDEHQRAVASVVINRKNDSRFPNTINEVVYQKGQYGCVYNGMINRTPNQRAYDNAKYVLENGVTIPSNVVWQSRGKQGVGVYKYIQGHYFCY